MAASGAFLVQCDIFCWNSALVAPYLTDTHSQISVKKKDSIQASPPGRLGFFIHTYISVATGPGFTALTVHRSLSSRDQVLVIASSAAFVPPAT